jgi:dTDP-4-dehydrorhamnose reductase
LNVYGKAKLEGEQAALTLTQRSAVIRVSGLFGSARSNLVTQMVDCFREGREVFAVKDQRCSPSYTQDVARGLERLIEHRGGEIPRVLHLANGEGATRHDVAQKVADLLHFQKGLIRPCTWEELHRPAPRPSYSQLDCGRFEALTGYALRPWQEALTDFLLSYPRKTS